MELTHQFTVPASVGDAWAAFNDLERIAPCFPGAALTAYDGDTFEGLCKIKLGPISLQYTGTGRFLERDETAHRAVIEAKGKDKRGNGTAAATVTATLQAAGDSATDVIVKTDLNITGKPAQFGRGVMQDVSDKLLGQFSSCLETKLGGPDEDADSGPVPADADEGTPIADAAAAAATSGPAAAADSNGSARPASSSSASSSSASSSSAASGSATAGAAAAGTPRRTPTAAPAAELDLGSTVLPVLLKRYAPQIIGGLVGLWLLRKILHRRHH